MPFRYLFPQAHTGALVLVQGSAAPGGEGAISMLCFPSSPLALSLSAGGFVFLHSIKADTLREGDGGPRTLGQRLR